MSLLFVHDHKFKVNKNRIYSNGCFGDEVLKRYTGIFGKMIFAARIRNEDNISGLSEIKNTDVLITDAYNDTKKLAELVKKADYIIVRLPSVLGIKAVYMARKYKKPYAVELVGCPWDSFWNHSLKGKAVAPFMWLLTKLAVKKAPFVLYVSERFLQRRYPTKGKLVSCSNVLLDETSEDVPKNRRDKKGQLVLATAGAVDVKYKGQQYVIMAIARLKKMGYNIKYRIAGGGNPDYLKDVACKYGVDDCVEFCGLISHDKIFDFYDKVDIYIQPSVTEGLPRALIEAMSRGCAVIGSDAGGIPELVPEDCVFKKKSVSDLERVLKSTIDTGFDKWIEQNKKRAGDFGADKLNKRRNEFYGQFIQSSGV